MIRVLHISDLHYHESTYHGFALRNKRPNARERPTMVDAITAAIEDIGPIHAIVVTGDLTWSATQDEFQWAEEEIERLKQSLNVDNNVVLLIPGNHDADWAKEKGQRFDNFKRAFKHITLKDSSESCEQTMNIADEFTDVRFIGVNSAIIESKDDQGTGLVGVQLVERMMRECTSGMRPDRIAVTILCMHHHLLPVAYIERDYFTNVRKRTSVTLDAKAILDLCARYKIRMVLHGHQHQPSLISYASLNPLNPNPEQRRLLWVSGAGSAGVCREHLGDVGRRHFQVLEFERKHDVVSCRVIPFAASATNQYDFERVPSTPISLYDARAPEIGWRMGDLDSAQADFVERLNRVTANDSVEIQHVGLDMHQAGRKLLEMLKCDFPVTKVTLNLLVVTEDLTKITGPFKPGSVPHTVELMPGKVKHSVEHIVDILGDVIDERYRRQGKQLTVNIKSYTALPSIHGFSLLAGLEPDQTHIATYCSFFRWVKKEGQEPRWDYDWGGRGNSDSYLRILGEPSDPLSRDMIAIFRGEFAHLWDEGTETHTKVYGL